MTPQIVLLLMIIAALVVTLLGLSIACIHLFNDRNGWHRLSDEWEAKAIQSGYLLQRQRTKQLKQEGDVE